jgi:hypothetical protein
MFEKLLSLLLHAKGGAVATVLVLGASGALVTATVENGMNTVTITQPSTTTGSNTTTGSTTTSNTTTNNTVTQTVLALFNKTKGEDDPTETAKGNGCSDAAHATNEQVKRVDAGFKIDHAAVLALSKTAPKTDAARTLVRTSDSKIKGFRQAAVKQIHKLFNSDACKGNDDADKAEADKAETDEDKDTEDDDNGTKGATGATGASGASGATGATGTTGTTVAISCSDAKACADAAIAAMDAEVTNLKTALGNLPAAAPATTKTDKAKSDNKSTKSTNKGKGHSEGRSHETEADD